MPKLPQSSARTPGAEPEGRTEREGPQQAPIASTTMFASSTDLRHRNGHRPRAAAGGSPHRERQPSRTEGDARDFSEAHATEQQGARVSECAGNVNRDNRGRREKRAATRRSTAPAERSETGPPRQGGQATRGRPGGCREHQRPSRARLDRVEAPAAADPLYRRCEASAGPTEQRPTPTRTPTPSDPTSSIDKKTPPTSPTPTRKTDHDRAPHLPRTRLHSEGPPEDVRLPPALVWPANKNQASNLERVQTRPGKKKGPERTIPRSPTARGDAHRIPAERRGSCEGVRKVSRTRVGIRSSGDSTGRRQSARGPAARGHHGRLSSITGGNR